jgi:tetratricopeptide (TPR) repeat protein
MRNCNQAINYLKAEINLSNVKLIAGLWSLKPAKKILLAAIILGFIVSCSSSPISMLASNVSYSEQNALNALKLQNTEEALKALDVALIEYQQIDDMYGRWRILSLKAKLAIGSSNLSVALEISPTLADIAAQLDDNMVSYQTNMLQGRIHLDDVYFRRALNYASSHLEQATVYTYLEEPQRAVALIDSGRTDHPSERAFIFYQAGIVSNSLEDFKRALHYYRAAQDSRGVADSLLRLARVSAKQSNIQAARRYADRAIIALESANHTKNASAIRRWVQTL